MPSIRSAGEYPRPPRTRKLILFSTTEPPRLSSTHPLRRAFQLHGTVTARHWLLSILLTVSVAILLCYGVLFLPESLAATRFRHLPRHVWTSTTEFQGTRHADVEMRQVWVHGDYMKALDLQVLRQALSIQDMLIFQGLNEQRDSIPSACMPQAVNIQSCPLGFHSPLMYWDCSLDALEADSDVLATINAGSDKQTFLNLTLRPSSVFAGKVFSNSKLRAADALVLTVFHQPNSNVSRAWDLRASSLGRSLSSRWSVYPSSGIISQSRLYEFRFRPMTSGDNLLLGMTYLLMALYVLGKLRKLRAVKSRVGLVITVACKV